MAVAAGPEVSRARSAVHSQLSGQAGDMVRLRRHCPAFGRQHRGSRHPERRTGQIRRRTLSGSAAGRLRPGGTSQGSGYRRCLRRSAVCHLRHGSLSHPGRRIAGGGVQRLQRMDGRVHEPRAPAPGGARADFGLRCGARRQGTRALVKARTARRHDRGGAAGGHRIQPRAVRYVLVGGREYRSADQHPHAHQQPQFQLPVYPWNRRGISGITDRGDAHAG